MTNRLRSMMLAAMMASAPVPVIAAPSVAPVAPTRASVEALERSLHPRTGDVVIPAARAVLHLGERYYFLPTAEAKRVLVEAWGNPPSTGDGVLGLVMEKGTTIADSVWGAVITFEDTGHVSDADAREQDYAKVLSDLQQATEQSNEERRAAGYPAMHLVGWAQAPTYDAASHSLIWARQLRLEGDQSTGLNYDVRLLGRGGVLSLNMLSDMEHLPEVRGAASAFGRSVSFQPGATYADYDPDIDKTAEFGLAGLVAGGVGVAAAKKLGLLALLAGFGKKLLILIPLAGVAIWNFARRLFGRGPTADES